MPRQLFRHPNSTLISTSSRAVTSEAARVPPWRGALRQPTPPELVQIYALEAASYPADEAATEEKLEFRLEHASAAPSPALVPPSCPPDPLSDVGIGGRPAFFRAMWCTQASHGCEVGDLLGFICATLAPTEELLEETMAGHDPAGSTLCIHSVVTAGGMRRRGVAQTMLREYIAHVRGVGGVRLLKLLTKPYNAPLYEKAGFTHLGEWAGEHGSLPWLEMELRLEK